MHPCGILEAPMVYKEEEIIDAKFLNLSTIGTVGWTILWRRAGLEAVLCIIGCLTASLVPLDAGSITQYDHQKVSLDIARCPMETICPLSLHQETR